MAISGLVVTLSLDEHVAQAAVWSLRGDPRLSVGEQFERRVAVVAETPGPDHDRDLWRELHALPGIVRVDVTFVGLDDTSQTTGVVQ